MNTNDNYVPCKTQWDLEFEALHSISDCVHVPISMRHWNYGFVDLNMKTKEEIIVTMLEKIWKSLQTSMNPRLSQWIEENGKAPTPEEMICLIKQCTTKYKNLVETSPFIIGKLKKKINNTIGNSKKTPLCTKKMEYSDFTTNDDVLECLFYIEDKARNKAKNQNGKMSTYTNNKNNQQDGVTEYTTMSALMNGNPYINNRNVMHGNTLNNETSVVGSINNTHGSQVTINNYNIYKDRNYGVTTLGLYNQNINSFPTSSMSSMSEGSNDFRFNNTFNQTSRQQQM